MSFGKIYETKISFENKNEKLVFVSEHAVQGGTQKYQESVNGEVESA